MSEKLCPVCKKVLSCDCADLQYKGIVGKTLDAKEVPNKLSTAIKDYISDVESGIKYLETVGQDYGYGKSRLRLKAALITSLLTRKSSKCGSRACRQ